MAEKGVSFRWKDYRAKGRTRHKTMTLAADEFMRRFLLHVLPLRTAGRCRATAEFGHGAGLARCASTGTG